MWCFVLVFFCYNTIVGGHLEVSVKVNYIEVPTEYEYSFFEGETVFITCVNKNPNTRGIKITSDDFEYIGNKTNYQMAVNETSLYIKLSKEYNERYIHCNIGNYNGSTLGITRIKLIYGANKKPIQHEPCRHTFDESLNNCYKDDPAQTVSKDCVFPRNFPIIKGLSKSKILAAYYKNKRTLVIAYEFNYVGEEFNLECIANNYTWTVDGSVTNKTISTNVYTFQINSMKMADVNCKNINDNKSTTIFFYRIKKPVTTTTSTETTTISVSNSDNSEIVAVKPKNTTYLEPKGKSHKSKSVWSIHDPIIIGAAAAIVIILLFVVICCCIKFAKKNPKPLTTDTNIDYTTLPEHNQGAMPTPSQWQDAQYAAPTDRIANNDYAVPFQPTLEEMYSKPTPKSERNASNHDSLRNSPSDKTARPVPKFSYVSQNKVLPTDTTLSYAKLNKPVVAVKPVIKNESPYAEICSSSLCSSESPYAEVNYAEPGITYTEPNSMKNNGYANVFDNQRYVNTNSNKNDYAEPAYCDLSGMSKFKKGKK